MGPVHVGGGPAGSRAGASMAAPELAGAAGKENIEAAAPTNPGKPALKVAVPKADKRCGVAAGGRFGEPGARPGAEGGCGGAAGDGTRSCMCRRPFLVPPSPTDSTLSPTSQALQGRRRSRTHANVEPSALAAEFEGLAVRKPARRQSRFAPGPAEQAASKPPRAPEAC